MANEGQIELFPITKKKYILFTKDIQNTADNGKNSIKLQFIDSYKFLNINFDKLASFLNKDKLRMLQREFSALSAENFDPLTRNVYFCTLTALKSWRRRVYHRMNRFTVC